MKKIYSAPKSEKVSIKTSCIMTIGSVDLTGNEASTTNGTYNTLSRHGYTWDDEDEENY